jgi:hypothetical protein
VDGLDRILGHDGDGLAAVRANATSRRVGTFDTPTGPVVTIDGRKLHSGRDPVREARRWARTLDVEGATVVILFGYGSGYAARAIAERTNAAIVVFEPDVEVLTVGLQHGPVPHNMVAFTTPDTLGRYLARRLAGIDRGFVATWTASVRGGSQPFAEAMAAANDAIGRAKLRHRTACLRGRGWLDHYVTNLRQLVDCPGLPALAGSLRGVPAIIAAAGPSLDRNVQQLQQWLPHALVLTVNSAARALARAGVQPHALVSIESADVTAGLEGLPWLHDLPAFLELTGNPGMWAQPFRRRVALSVDTNGCSAFSERTVPGFGMSAGFCVANAAVAVAHRLGCDPIILVGSDLAYSGTRVYASGTMFEEMRAEPSGDGTVRMEGLAGRRLIEERSTHALGGNHMPTTAHTIEIPAWEGSGTVVTTRDFAMFRDFYAHFARVHPEATLVNATEGGAFIEGWEHVPLAEIAKRLGIGDKPPTVPVGQRFDEALERPALGRAKLAAAVAGEKARVAQLRELVAQALALVDHDPDGDLHIDAEGIGRLHELNAACRALLADAPLAAEACFVPVEELRGRGDITTYSLYASLDGPLRDLDEELARLLQSIENTEGG